jgi:DNA-binding PadR family transcriptional regulator
MGECAKHDLVFHHLHKEKRHPLEIIKAIEERGKDRLVANKAWYAQAAGQ